MKYAWQVVSILLAAALAVLSVSLLFVEQSEPAEAPKRDADVVLNTIMTRSSVRQYTDQEVTPQHVETLLRAGMAAPTAGNRQPWAFYVVRDTAIIRQFPKVTKFSDPMAQQARVAIVVCGVPEEAFPVEPRYWVQDVSAATENILLAAHATGLGAVWSGVYPGEERVATLRQLLDVPERLVPFNIIFLGHPSGEPSVKDKWRPERIFHK